MVSEKKDVLISSFALLCGSVRPNRTYLREKKRILSVGIGKRVSCGAKKVESIFCPPASGKRGVPMLFRAFFLANC